jgi:hypothetical protein
VAVAALLQARQRLAHGVKLACVKVRQREIHLAFAFALRRVVAVLLQHLVRVFGAGAALVVLGHAAVELAQALVERGLQQGLLAGGEVLHAGLRWNPHPEPARAPGP